MWTSWYNDGGLGGGEVEELVSSARVEAARVVMVAGWAPVWIKLTTTEDLEAASGGWYHQRGWRRRGWR